MEYFISFLEGIITFISPCLLPMLPVYLSYFAGSEETGDNRSTMKNAIGFVLGFTAVFVLMGAFAGSIGSFLVRYRTAVNLVSGGIVILFGLSFLGLVRLRLPHFGSRSSSLKFQPSFPSSLLFGMVFSVSWTPCVGAFLGSALMMASRQGSVLRGTAMLLVYSLGLGIPFLLSAVLLDRMKTAFNWIKKHYTIINRICGIFLILVGLSMVTGFMGKLLSLLSN